MLHLGEVEVGSKASLDELMGVVEEVNGEIEDGSRDGDSIDEDTGLLQMPASRSANEKRGRDEFEV